MDEMEYNDFHHATGPGSGFLTSQIWKNDRDDVQTNGVEIVELDSTDNSQSSLEDEPTENGNSLCHPWSYAAKIKELEDKYKANRQARLRRRLRNRNRFPETSNPAIEFDDSFYFNNSECATPDTADVETFKQTCFTILDKLSALDLNSSSEDFEVSSIGATCGDIMMEPGWNGDGECGEEVITYSEDVNGEKRTVWIYSVQNRRILSDHDYELVNISSQDTCNSEIEEELNTSKSSNRVSSPIPALHVPRLNLSLGATLPNVTEVTEPKSSESLNLKHVPIKQKPANNWCLDSGQVCEKATSVVNWMALSPRERRRQARRNHNDISIPLLPVHEVSQDKEKPPPTNKFHELFETKTEPTISKTEETQNHEHFEIEIANETLTSMPSQIHSQRTFIDSKPENFLDNATYLMTPLAKRNVDLSLKHKVSKIELRKLKNLVRGSFSDRGDYNINRPRVSIDKPVLSAVIKLTENLDSNDWITEQSCHNQKAGDKLVFKNRSYLNPSEWEAYTAINKKVSLDLDPELQTKKTLFKRCINCFKCCK